MRIDKVYIKEFKNLKEFSVELDTEQLTNVFIGKNGAGKSNFIEALVIIFRDLDLKTVTIEFSYEIEYYCKNVTVNIDEGYWTNISAEQLIDYNPDVIYRTKK